MKLVLGFLFVISLVAVKSEVDDFSFSDEQWAEITELISQTLLLDSETAIVVDTALVPVAEDAISLRFFNNETTNVNGTNVFVANSTILLNMTDFDLNLDTYFLIHGWNNNCTESPMILSLKEAILSGANFNIFTVCWDDFSDGLYTVARIAVPQVGKYLGQFIRNVSNTYNYSLSHFTIIGHSLGAHISGYAGKELGGNLSHIVGLDPAGPLYTQLLSNYRLAKSDAKYVEVVHTDSATLGVSYNVGDIDYWPNSGVRQPGCGVDITTSCSHGRAYYYYAESLKYNDSFLSTSCSLYAKYLLGACSGNTQSYMGGFSYNTSETETYYLKTNSSSPYSLGED